MSCGALPNAMRRLKQAGPTEFALGTHRLGYSLPEALAAGAAPAYTPLLAHRWTWTEMGLWTSPNTRPRRAIPPCSSSSTTWITRCVKWAVAGRWQGARRHVAEVELQDVVLVLEGLQA